MAKNTELDKLVDLANAASAANLAAAQANQAIVEHIKGTAQVLPDPVQVDPPTTVQPAVAPAPVAAPAPVQPRSFFAPLINRAQPIGVVVGLVVFVIAASVLTDPVWHSLRHSRWYDTIMFFWFLSFGVLGLFFGAHMGAYIQARNPRTVNQPPAA